MTDQEKIPESEVRKKDWFICRPQEFEKTIEVLQRDGAEKLHVISDFDGTLTKEYSHGEKRPSLISLLRKENYLGEDYVREANALAEFYRPLENDEILPLSQRKKLMDEWWRKHFELMIRSRLNRRVIEEIMRKSQVQLRDGAEEFLELLQDRDIPLVIFSSTGLGGDAIELFFENARMSMKNVHVIANRLEWDSSGFAVGVREPVIHSLNKDETVIRDLPVWPVVAGRPNVLLLGDSLGDIGMVQGFLAQQILKFGFVNDEVEKRRPTFETTFDALVLNDGSMAPLHTAVQNILSKNPYSFRND